MVIFYCVLSYMLVGTIVSSMLYIFGVPKDVKGSFYGLVWWFWPIVLLVLSFIWVLKFPRKFFNFYHAKVLLPLKERHKAYRWKKQNAQAFKNTRVTTSTIR